MIESAFQHTDFAITICDDNWIITYMNDKAVSTFEKYGGLSLIGKNLLDCHNETSREMLHQLKKEQRSNSYTIEKNGVKKLIHQTPLSLNEKFNGFMEVSIVLPVDMKHLVRT